jgi:hypothetical protein
MRELSVDDIEIVAGSQHINFLGIRIVWGEDENASWVSVCTSKRCSWDVILK